MNLQEMINDNIAVLEAESSHQEMLAKQKLQRQREALIEIRDEIKPVIEEERLPGASRRRAAHGEIIRGFVKHEFAYATRLQRGVRNYDEWVYPLVDQ